MDNLDRVRARQKSEKSGSPSDKNEKRISTSPQSEKSVSAAKKRKKRKKRKIRGIVIKTLILLFIAFVIFAAVWVALNIDFTFGDDLSSMNLNLSSSVYYIDEDGAPQRYEQFVAAENRIWVSIDRMPENLKNAFIAIEDQRFEKHHGVDIKRTGGAVLNYVLKGDSSYGGSTITQQLVKNITNDKERTKTRKIREMLRAIVLESKLSKEQILEMYLNTIYLGHGANGAEAAANVYFSKDVSELSLAECACIAGITQYPTKYDPLINPDNNAEKRTLVLNKMEELGYISKDECESAKSEKLKFKSGKTEADGTQSYFLDNLFEVLLDDLMEKGYAESFATNMIYNGGLKIYSTVDPEIQSTMEEVFEDDSSFPSLGGSEKPQCAMVVSDPKTGQVKGIVGGRGKKEGNRVLNRATQTNRQPGSSIKPLAVYGPAVDLGIVTAATMVDDSYLEINDWEPKNADKRFRGYVSVKNAVAYSYNIPAIRILEEVTVDKSYHYLKDKLHMESVVSKVTKNGKVYSDKNLSSLALGGFTEGVTVMEMNSAYCAFANEGVYIEPSVYTKVYDADGRILLEKEPQSNRAFSKETAFIMNELLSGVVEFGTGAGAGISNMDTCGKTGTSDDTKDRWFIGYTPYYAGSVWFGYDVQKTISAYGNPALNVWKKVMTKIHKPLSAKHFEAPSGVEKLTVCTNTGKKPSASCSRATVYANKEFALEQCTGKHEYIGTKSKKSSSSSSTHTSTTTDKKDEKPTTDPDSGTDTSTETKSETTSPAPSHSSDNTASENKATATITLP